MRSRLQSYQIIIAVFFVVYIFIFLAVSSDWPLRVSVRVTSVRQSAKSEIAQKGSFIQPTANQDNQIFIGASHGKGQEVLNTSGEQPNNLNEDGLDAAYVDNGSIEQNSLGNTTVSPFKLIVGSTTTSNHILIVDIYRAAPSLPPVTTNLSIPITLVVPTNASSVFGDPIVCSFSLSTKQLHQSVQTNAVIYLNGYTPHRPVKWAAANIRCPVPDEIELSDLAAVSLSGAIKVEKSIPYPHTASLPPPRHRLSLCIGPLFGDISTALIDWVEYYRLNGVSHFYIYATHVSEPTMNLLSYYEGRGIFTVYNWTRITDSKFKDGWYMHQMSLDDDCLNRHRHLSQYIGYVDTDELIMNFRPINDGLEKNGTISTVTNTSNSISPKPPPCSDTLLRLLDCWETRDSFSTEIQISITNAFFDTLIDVSIPSRNSILPRMTRRLSTIFPYRRTKMVVKPNMTIATHIHEVFPIPRSNQGETLSQVWRVPSEEAVVFHFRRLKNRLGDGTYGNRRDATLWKICGQNLEARTGEVRKETGFWTDVELVKQLVESGKGLFNSSRMKRTKRSWLKF
ncbi:glycosyltransferase family 92-domain-containing protein [Paraphysoderma sedebokerense]|nr:glycosyltransferase family 92-domain-containing protein [Paraphysoderma sedebokerense]